MNREWLNENGEQLLSPDTKKFSQYAGENKLPVCIVNVGASETIVVTYSRYNMKKYIDKGDWFLVKFDALKRIGAIARDFKFRAN